MSQHVYILVMVEYKGKTFTKKPIKYKDWLKLSVERKQAIDKDDAVDVFESIKKWTLSATDCTAEFFDDLTLDEILEFQQKINEADKLPLPKKEPSVEQ